MPTGSRVQVMNGNANKTSSGMTKSMLKKNPKTGRLVSKAKSSQAKQKMRSNKRMQLRKQATSEVTKGRRDVKDLFKPGDTKIKRDVRKRYEELLQQHGLSVKSASKTAKKRPAAKKSNKKKPTKRSRGGWFY